MVLPRSSALTSLHGCGVEPLAGALIGRNVPPPLLCHASFRKNQRSLSLPSSSSSRSGGLHLQKGKFVSEKRRRPLRPVDCFSTGGGGGNRREEEGVEEEDADIEELLTRSRRRLVIDVHPLQESRREEEEAASKGREMLFRQFCLHLGLTPQEFRAMWWACGGGDSDGGEERQRLVRDFLEEEWGWRYRPLSPRAAVEMLDEHMGSQDGRAAGGGATRAPPHTTSAAHRRRRGRLLPNWWR